MTPHEIAELVQLRRARDHVDRHCAEPLDESHSAHFGTEYEPGAMTQVVGATWNITFASAQ